MNRTTPMRNGRILVSGAGISGLALAYWLKQHGFEPTLIEQARSPRISGDIVHAFGPGYGVLERMGVADRIRRSSLDLKEIEFVDAGHRLLRRSPLHAGAEGEGACIRHIPRSSLEAGIREALAGKVEIRYGATIRRLDRQPDGVSVLFEDHDWEKYDLVIGADGLHSNVRRQAFGADDRYAEFRGYHLAMFTFDAHVAEGKVECHISPQRCAGMFSRGGLATAFFLFRGQPRLGIGAADIAGQKRCVRGAFADAGWHCPWLLECMERAGGFHFLPVSRIRMDAWSGGRIALVGDAAYCLSPLSGHGASLALSGAYILAGELKAAEGDPDRAFAEYEKRLRPVVSRRLDEAGELPFHSLPKMGAWLNGKVTGWFGNPLIAKIAVAQRLADAPILADY